MKIALDAEDNVYQFNDLKVIEENSEIVKAGISGMTTKDKLLKAKSLILFHKPTNRVMFELNMINAQHFYPLSILDYANSLKKLMQKEISSLPILSLDSHDYNFCDFNCKDCLAVDTREWAAKELHFTKFDVEHYEKVLTEIARYSKQRGIDSIRFEMSGEGNPDMYPDRERIIRFAKEKCNMKSVYITSGSRLDEATIDALAKYAYYVRVSMPGTNNNAYDIYSAQKLPEDKKFKYDDSLKLIKKLVEKRKEYHREGELVIGARTCMRPENEGSYLETARRLGEMGADSFQIVKIIIPTGEDIEKYKLSQNTIDELKELRNNYAKYNLMHVQVPHDLDYVYYDRKIDDDNKPSQCYSSFVSPILYGPNLVMCTHWEKIKDKDGSHYGHMTGEVNQLEDIMCNQRACKMRKDVPDKCSSCCAIYDNLMLEMIKSQLALVTKLDEVDFLLTY